MNISLVYNVSCLSLAAAHDPFLNEICSCTASYIDQSKFVSAFTKQNTESLELKLISQDASQCLWH